MQMTNPKCFRSLALNCRLYWDKENTGEIFTTVEQAAIACSCSEEDIKRSIPYKPNLVTIDGREHIFVTFMQLTDFLHKFRPSVLAECLLIAATQTKV
jgi:hypothetical protein